MKEIVAIMLIGTGLAFAGTGLNCNEVTQMKADEIQQCVEQTDDELNENYKELMKMYKELPVRSKALKETQRAWIKFRDAECAYQLSGSASSTQEDELNICMVQLTIQRNEAFEEYLK